MPWEDVKKEMTEEKGLDPVVADRIGEYVSLRGKRHTSVTIPCRMVTDESWRGNATGHGTDLLARLQGDEKLMSIQSAKEGLADMELLFGYLEIFGVLDKVG
jgi:histidyl-tRNA synthetase